MLGIPGIVLYLLACLAAGVWLLACRRPAGPLRLPRPALLGLAALLAIGLAQALALWREAAVFWLFFVAAAGLPPLAPVALASLRLGPAISWRRALAGLVTGSLLSPLLVVLLSGAVALAAYLVVLPLRAVLAGALASPDLERLFYSPALALALVEMAIVAPLVEELCKPLAVAALARRLRGPEEAFLLGMAGGAGFAILENMLYEAAGPRLWAGIALLRGVGGALHPFNAGLVALGWCGVRRGLPGAGRRWLGYYGLAVGLHALWNGGQALLFSDFGAYFFGADTWRLDVYGLGQPGVMIVALLLESLALWRLLLAVTARLAASPGTPPAGLGLGLEQPRRLALWATALAFLLVPLGALYGPLLAHYAERLAPLH